MDDSTPIIDVTAHPADYLPADDIWAFLRRRKGAIAFFWLLGMLVAVWWILSRPSVYQAESRVMIVRTGSGGPVSEAELASEIELIQDPSHIDKTATKQIVNPSDAQIHEFRSKINASLTVAPAGKSNLVAIQYRDSDPTTAARVVNQIVEFYLADRRFIFQTGGRATSEPNGPSTSAPDLLSAFDALNHGPQLHTELQSRVQRGIEIEARLSELKAQIRDRQESSAALRRRLSSLPERIRSRTRTRITAGTNAKQVEETEIVNPLRQQIESELVNNDSAIAGLQARLEATASSLREARTAEDRASALASEREKLERRITETRSPGDSNAASERPNLRATLINRAEPPYGPVPSHVALWIPVALAISLLLAMLIAWLIDQFDKPIYTSHDFERASGVPPMDNFARGAGA